MDDHQRTGGKEAKITEELAVPPQLPQPPPLQQQQISTTPTERPRFLLSSTIDVPPSFERVDSDAPAMKNSNTVRPSHFIFHKVYIDTTSNAAHTRQPSSSSSHRPVLALTAVSEDKSKQANVTSQKDVRKADYLGMITHNSTAAEDTMRTLPDRYNLLSDTQQNTVESSRTEENTVEKVDTDSLPEDLSLVTSQKQRHRSHHHSHVAQKATQLHTFKVQCQYEASIPVLAHSL